MRPEDVARAVALYDDGRSVRYIANVMNMARSTTHDAIKRYCNEIETLAHVLGSCQHGELLRNSRHHNIRKLIAQALRNKSFEVHEEVHCVVSEGGGIRRADIVALDKTNSKGFILDPTVRFEMSQTQPSEVNKEKQQIYEPTIPYFREKYQMEAKIFRKRLRFHQYRLQLLQALKPEDKVLLRNFWMSIQTLIENDDEFISSVVFSDEVTFQLSGRTWNHCWTAIFASSSDMNLFWLAALSSVVLLHDNARPHVADRTATQLQSFGWKIMEHPPYSPDLAPSDCHVFGSLMKFLAGQTTTQRALSGGGSALYRPNSTTAISPN
ncbi:hypothetical protein ANN_25922 [Periplaneta americana]|uniref:Uncharacterized protein n=1 Tax=Periplaneta americana TaxID=6978 RepID=A0ABQ8S4X7_PERAM|nr:hypothetical protein ANN_25922 [Periplaneta americana]